MTTLTLVREIARGLVSGEDHSSQETNPVTMGTIANFGTSQVGTKTEEEQIAELRASIQEAADGWTPAFPIEDVLTSPPDKF